MVSLERIREATYKVCPIAQIVVKLSGSLALVNEQARSMFGLTPADLGRPFQDLAISYQPVELRSCIEQAYAERRTISIKDVKWTIPGEGDRFLYLEVQVALLQDASDNLLGVSITFNDVSRCKQLQQELERSNQDLEVVYEELQSNNEELETTNEELQSCVEEIETTNEELQSTSEELQTMNEELQSINEELQTLNEELHRRSNEVNGVNSFLQSILSSFRSGVVVVNQDMQIQVWNHAAQDLWGLRSDAVKGQYILDILALDIGLPLEPLVQLIRACLAGALGYQTLSLPAINRRGRRIQCQVSCSPLITREAEIQGVILLMDEE